MGRKIAAVLAGILAGLVVIGCIEAVSHFMYAPDVLPDRNDPKAMAAFIAAMPMGAFLMVLLAYVAGTLAGGWTAARVTKEKPLLYAGIIGGLVLLGAVANFIAIPHPLWFMVSCVVTIPLAAYLAARLAIPAAAQTPAA